MATKTDIANQALMFLGISTFITDLDTDTTLHGDVLRRAYDDERKTLLRRFHWRFASKLAALALVAADPNDEWAFSYTRPSDCLKMRRISNGARLDTPESKIPFDRFGTLIFTDQPDAIAEYTENVTDATLFPTDFATALAAAVAVRVAPIVTGGDPYRLGERAAQALEYYLGVAGASDGNESTPDEQDTSTFERARG